MYVSRYLCLCVHTWVYGMGIRPRYEPDSEQIGPSGGQKKRCAGNLGKEGILIRGATPIVPIVTAKQWRHQVVAMSDPRSPRRGPGGSNTAGQSGHVQRRRNMFWSGGAQE